MPKKRDRQVASAERPGPTTRDPLTRLLRERERTFHELLNQLSHQIQERHRLSADVIQDLDVECRIVEDELLTLRQWPTSIDMRFDRRRQRLEEQLHGLQQERRRETVDRWRDVNRLGHELRSWRKQQQDLIQRRQLLTSYEPNPARQDYDPNTPQQDP